MAAALTLRNYQETFQFSAECQLWRLNFRRQTS